MGQGGRFLFLNCTKYTWVLDETRTDHDKDGKLGVGHQVQIDGVQNSKRLEPGQAVGCYVEWKGGSTQSDSQVNVWWNIQGTGTAAAINLSIRDGNQKNVFFNPVGFGLKGRNAGEMVNVGFVHDGAVAVALFGDEGHFQLATVT